MENVSIPDDHVADFHYMDDVRDIWNAVKARFGGIAEITEVEVALTLKTKDGLKLLSFDDLYYKLKTLEEIEKREEDFKALISVDTLVDCAIAEGAAKIYNLIIGADTKEASTAGDAEEFALMGTTSERSTQNDCALVILGVKSSLSPESNVLTPMHQLPVYLHLKSELRLSPMWDPIQETIIVQDLPYTHLIKDCDFYEKQMANKTVGNGVGPVHSRNNFPTGKPKVPAPVPTGRQNRPFPVPTDRGYSPSVTSVVVQKKDYWKRDNLNSHTGLLCEGTATIQLVLHLSDFPRGNLACLVAKASVDESVKWHRRMGHVNYKNMNRLVSGNLVRGLPPKLFKNDHTCVACCKGKQHKASYKAITTVSSISEPLQLLHMDLFGPTSIRSIDHKYYCLVITDDYSRFCWVFFLEHKDETYPILKDFINLVENQLNKKVKAIRCDNGTEFKNAHIIELCGSKGIKRDYSNARTPQQNGVAERKNRTLIEAARTMLADSKLPTMFWTEAAINVGFKLTNLQEHKEASTNPAEADAIIDMSGDAVDEFSLVLLKKFFKRSLQGWKVFFSPIVVVQFRTGIPIYSSFDDEPIQLDSTILSTLEIMNPSPGIGIHKLVVVSFWVGGGLMGNARSITYGYLSIEFVQDSYPVYKNKFSPQWRFLVHTILHCLSTKSGSWDQFGSSLVVALICLSDWEKFTKLLNFEGQPMQLLAAMLPQYQEGEGAGVAAQAVPPPIPEPILKPMPKPDQLQDHLSTPPRQQTSNTAVSTLVQKVNSLETKLKDTKKLFKDVVAKLVKKVKAMEVKLKTKKRKVVVIDSDQEEGGEQDVDLDAILALANAAVIVDSNIPPGGASNSHIPTDIPPGGASSSHIPTNVPTGVAPVP
ncbi:putative ribonuclease H-like domain-containing protein [Tanacetum coccineum]|uniref:Ribonuclease H-like domain-containing protein n=1 Tax=Tanacetum coccineum TaxID=301880 RepID=A0ABQ5AWF7_9ASTR